MIRGPDDDWGKAIHFVHSQFHFGSALIVGRVLIEISIEQQNIFVYQPIP
jgi:hypothetical protein